MKKNSFEYLVLLFTMIAVPVAMAADQLKVTVCSSGCNYLSVNAAVVAQEQDLVSNDKYLDIEIQEAFDDTEPVTIENYTTDATHYINIYTDATARHDGTTDSGYALYPGAGNGNCITIGGDYDVYIDGLEFILEGTGYNHDQAAVTFTTTVSPTLYFSNNIVWQTENSGNYTKLRGIVKSYSGTHKWYIWNNIFAELTGVSDNASAAIWADSYGGGSFYIYNNTISGVTGSSNTSYGVKVGVGTGFAKNNIVVDCDVDYSGTFSTQSSHNLSSDTSAPPQGTYYTEKTITFNDKVNGDYSLPVGETDAVGKGKFLGNDSSLDFLDDINGLTRGGTWDMGADQYQTTDYIPITMDFDILSFGSVSRNFTVDIYKWDTYIQTGTVDEYCLTESSETPELNDDCWEVSEPTSYTFGSNGDKTLYAWLKSDTDQLSAQSSDTITIKNVDGTTSAFWANNGDNKVRQDEIRKIDYDVFADDNVTNAIWDGTTIRIKQGKNGFSEFSVYIEAGENTLTNVTVEMSDLVNGENTIEYGTRTTSELFDFTLTDIEMFYVKYLQIRGLRGSGDYGVTGWAEDRWSEPMQRPNTPVWHDSNVYSPGYYVDMANAGTTWYDRPGADKYFPEILVPIELEPTFDVTAGTSQQIWTDIWIDKTVVAGTYTGNFVVKDDGVTIATIPVELEVYNFTLPDSHYMKSWGYFESTHWYMRFFGTFSPNYGAADAATKAFMVQVFKNIQFMIRRHGGINFADEQHTRCDITDNVPASDFRDFYNMLTGDLFNATDGYDGPAIEDPAQLFVIGTYGRWQNTIGNRGFFTDTISNLGDEAAEDEMQAAMDTCYTNLETLVPGIKKELWMVDEPWTQEAYDTVNKYGGWSKGCTGGGELIQTMVTGSVESGIRFGANNLDINNYRPGRLDCWARADEGGGDIVPGMLYYLETWEDSGGELFRYGGPYSDSSGYSIFSWQNYKDNVVWNLLWHMALWQNNEGGQTWWAEHTPLFEQASTLGPHMMENAGLAAKGNVTNSSDFAQTAGYQYKVLIDGEGTPDTFKWSIDDGDTWEETGVAITGNDQPLGTYEMVKFSNTTGHSVGDTSTWEWNSKWDDVYGHRTFGNGNGVMMYPGTDELYSDQNYEIDGPIASIRLKYYRKAVQDYDYLAMAALNCDSCVKSIMSGLGFTKVCEKIYDWSNIGYGGGNAWNENAIDYGSYDDFERARAELADIILGNTPPSKFKGTFNGVTK